MTTELEEERALLRTVTRHAERAAAELAARDAAILAASAAGATQRRIAAAAGLTHTGVAKILGRYYAGGVELEEAGDN